MNKNIIRLFTMLLVAVMMLSLISCAGLNNDKDKDKIVGMSTPVPIPEELIGTIVFSSYRTEEGEVAHFEYMQAFVMQYPSVDIELDLTNSYDEYFATLDERIKNGTIGDVFTIDAAMIAEYAEAELIVDLSEHSEGVIDYTSNEYEKLYPSKLFFPAAFENSLYEGRLYMCPVEYNNTVVFLNLDMLSKTDIDPIVPDDDWTWQDIEVIAEKLKEAGCTTPIVMDYFDYSVWGAFARSKGATLYNEISFSDKEIEMTLTNPDVISGIEYLANNFIRKGYVADKVPSELSASDLAQYGIVICNHSDLVRWGSDLIANEEADNGFEWELAHFPGFYNEETDTVNHAIGVQTIGLAVFNREQYNIDNGIYDSINDEELLEEEKNNVENSIINSIKFALYAMVKEAAVAITGPDGYRVPALMSANAMKYWRKYPVDGKNTSVFSLYNENDFAGELSSFLTLAPTNEIEKAMGSAIQKYSNDSDSKTFDKYMQEIQDAVNTH
ncbi:MAG: extracellular solute-binding protein [Ruminococcaceae bacterium]|nr:extracellular solute-binding protein [Oscillospiraceae bacterium]